MGVGAAIVGTGMSVAGAVGGARAARRQAALQNQANEYQAQVDRFNASANRLTLHGQADLDDLGAQAEYNTTLISAEFGRLQAGLEATSLRTQAAMSAGKLSLQALEAESAAELQEISAELKEIQAQQALLGGERGEQQVRLKYAQGKSRHTAQMARGNIALDEGAGLEVRTGYDVLSERDALDVRQQATMAAWGHRMEGTAARVRAMQQRGQAALARGMADMEQGIGNARADYTLSTADANANAAQALAAAGLISAQGNTQYARTMADISYGVADADASVRYHLGRVGKGPSIAMAGLTALGAGLPSLYSAWRNRKQT